MNATDIFGLIFVALVFFGSAYISFYLYVVFSHPMDKDFPGVWIVRVIIVIGSVLAFMLIFILPLDLLSAYEKRNMPFGFNFEMESIWMFTSICVLIVWFINNYFITYYRDSDEKKVIRRIYKPFICHGIILIVFLAIAGLIFMFMGNINFTNTLLIQDNSYFVYSEAIGFNAESFSADDYTIKYFTSSNFLLSLLTPLTIIGSLCFSVMGGAGMSFYPLALIKSYLNQPTRPKAEEHVLSKRILLEMNDMLIEKGRTAYEGRDEIDINPKINPIEKKMKLNVLVEQVSEMKKSLTDFEEVFIVFKAQDNIVDNNPIWYLINLILGLVFLVFSLIFFVHTLLCTQGFFVLLEMFFNAFMWINVIVSLFVFIFKSVFAGLAITKGSFLISAMFSSLLGVSPFKKNATWTDSFLFNNNVLLLSFLGMIVFFMRFAPNYFRFLSAELIFNRIITKISICQSLYGFFLFEYLFLLCYAIGLFSAFFIKSGKEILAEKVKEKQIQLEQERERLEGMKSDKKEEEEKKADGK